ncbi:uncharacterized protein LOC118687027 [Molothrus ater]|uniref:uncharacterized protein LOC118687027 n=1 Tax=Molothrus ater TaxID=84834 RepID=UPI0023E81807|nr:uncharacterized protein LOC118687027 [Molothrus ater]
MEGQAGWRKAVVVTRGFVPPITGTTGRAPQTPATLVSVPHTPAHSQGHLGTPSVPATPVPCPHRRCHTPGAGGGGDPRYQPSPCCALQPPCQPPGVPAGDTTQLHYAVVKKLRTYSGAQRYCQDVYRGRLASVHSAARNQELQKLARTYHIIISPWIGAVTSRRAGQWESYWEDSSPWNYANWAPTHPFHIVTTCTTLSVRGKVSQPPCPGLRVLGRGAQAAGALEEHREDGLWRSRFCFQLRPFICQY